MSELLRVAVVGSGPAGFYVAAALLDADEPEPRRALSPAAPRPLCHACGRIVTLSFPLGHASRRHVQGQSLDMAEEEACGRNVTLSAHVLRA